jgi:hypothetical protein
MERPLAGCAIGLDDESGDPAATEHDYLRLASPPTPVPRLLGRGSQLGEPGEQDEDSAAAASDTVANRSCVSSRRGLVKAPGASQRPHHEEHAQHGVAARQDTESSSEVHENPPTAARLPTAAARKTRTRGSGRRMTAKAMPINPTRYIA